MIEQPRELNGQFGARNGSPPEIEIFSFDKYEKDRAERAAQRAEQSTTRQDAPQEAPLRPTITRPWNEPEARKAAAEAAASQAVEEPDSIAKKASSVWNRLFGTGR